MKNMISDEHRRFPTFTARVACSLVACMLLGQASHAQQWVLQPEIRIGGEYDDNARLQSDSTAVEEIDGYILEGSLGIGYNTQRTTFQLTPKLRSRVYDEIPDVDSDDQFLNLNFAHETLKAQFRVRGSFQRESQRTGERTIPEFEVEDPEEIPTDETGLVLSNERRERFRIAPEWNYDVTERMTFGLRAAYSDVSYDDSPTSALVDYNDKRLDALIGRRFSERTQGYFAVGARRYDNELNLNEVEGLGAGVGVESDLSETTSLQVEVGYEDTEQVTTGESDANFVANLNLVRRLETITMLAQYRRNVAASGAGRVTARDSVNFTLRKQFTDRVSGGVGVRAIQSEGADQQALTLEERDLVQVRAQLAVALSRAFSVEGDYRYARVDRTGQVGSADSNSIILWLVYRPTPIVR
jgi:hypothetical protein